MLAAISRPGIGRQRGSLETFRKREERKAPTPRAFANWSKLALHKELAWVQKDLRTLEKSKSSYASFTSTVDLLATAYENIRRHLISRRPILPLHQAKFEAACPGGAHGLSGLVPKFVDLVVALLRLRASVMEHRAFDDSHPAPRRRHHRLRQLGSPPPKAASKHLPFLREELEWLAPSGFLAITPFERLGHCQRYLKALLVRADRALLNPVKDAERARQVRPYLDALAALNRKDLSLAGRIALSEFRWLIEEFKVSVFAQELGTAQPVSAKRLDAQLSAIRSLE